MMLQQEQIKPLTVELNSRPVRKNKITYESLYWKCFGYSLSALKVASAFRLFLQIINQILSTFI